MFHILLLAFASAFFGTITGFGTSTIMVPILAIWFPMPEVLFFVGIIHLFGDVWKMYFFKKGASWKLLALFGIPGIIASYFTASIPLSVDPGWLRKLLAVFLLVDTLFIFTHPRWKLAKSNNNAVLGGVLSGVFAGVFGIGGAVRGAFLAAFDLPKSVYIFASGVIAFLIDSSRLIRYYQGGVVLDDLSYILLLYALPVSFLSAFFAKRFVDKIPQRMFRYIVGIGLLISGAVLFFGA